LRWLLIMSLISGSVAVAAEADEAKTYYEAGKQAFHAGDYLTAIRSFEQAYQAAPQHPEIAFSLAQAYRKQWVVDGDAGKLKEAVSYYRRYLEKVPQGGFREDTVQVLEELQPVLARIEASGPIAAAPVAAATQLMVTTQVKGANASIDGEPGKLTPHTSDVTPGVHRIHVVAPGYFDEDLEGQAVAGRLVVVEANLRERPAAVLVVTDPGAAIEVDGHPVGTAPLAQAMDLHAGRHLIAVGARGHQPFAKEIELDRGEGLKLDAPLLATTQRKVAWWTLAASGAAVASGAITTWLALDAQSTAQGLVAKQQVGAFTSADLASYNDARDRRDRYRIASIVLLSAGAAGSAAGLLLFYLDEPHLPSPPAWSPIVPVLTPDEAGLAYQGRF
jgi:hypothetical protein